MRATGAGVLLTIGFILGAAGAAMAQVTDRQMTDQQATVLHLSQTAERSVLRDLLRIELRVEETGADPLAIQSVINRRMAAALDRTQSTPGRGPPRVADYAREGYAAVP